MIESSRRARTERGFALVSALLFALLFLGMMELALRDTTEGVRAAHRQRARLASEILADNALELAAAGMLSGLPKSEVRANADGTMTGTLAFLPGDRFELTGEGESAGVARVVTRVVLRGRIEGSSVEIRESETR